MGDTKMEKEFLEMRQENPMFQPTYNLFAGQQTGMYNMLQQGLGSMLSQGGTPGAYFNEFMNQVSPTVEGYVSRMIDPARDEWGAWADLASGRGAQATRGLYAGRGLYTGAAAGEIQKASMLPFLHAGAQVAGQLGAQRAGLGQAGMGLIGTGLQQQQQALSTAMRGYLGTTGALGALGAPVWNQQVMYEKPGILDTIFGTAAGGIVGGATKGIGGGLGAALAEAITGAGAQPPATGIQAGAMGMAPTSGAMIGGNIGYTPPPIYTPPLGGFAGGFGGFGMTPPLYTPGYNPMRGF